MARPRKFDKDEALAQAVELFWRHGYGATTYRLIESETGIGLRSLHNTFGEKDALFLRVLRLYHERAKGVLGQVFDPPSTVAVERLLMAMTEPTDPGDVANAGCLMVATVFEVGAPPEAIAQEIAAYRETFRAAFRAALEADAVPEAEARAEFLLGALWGLLGQIRVARSTAAARPMAEVLVQTVRSWTP